MLLGHAVNTIRRRRSSGPRKSSLEAVLFVYLFVCLFEDMLNEVIRVVNLACGATGISF